MSLTVNSRPATWAGTSGPIIYKMTTTDHANAGYYLLVEIWNSTTGLKIGTQKCYPNSAGLLSVRVEAILKSNMSLDNNSDLTSGDTVYLDGNWIKYYIKYNQYWSGSSPALIDDVANLRYAIYGGLQIGVTNDLSTYINSPRKFITESKELTAIFNHFLTVSFKGIANSYLKLKKYQGSTLIEFIDQSITNHELTRLSIKESVYENIDSMNLEIGSVTIVPEPSNWFDNTDWTIWSGSALAGSSNLWTEPSGLNIGIQSQSLAAGTYTRYYRNDNSMNFVSGFEYTFSLKFLVSSFIAVRNLKIRISLMDDASVVYGFSETEYLPSVINFGFLYTKTFKIIPSANATRIGIVAYADPSNAGPVECFLQTLIIPTYGLATEAKVIKLNPQYQNTIMLQWKNSLGGDECFPFTYNQEYTFDYGGGKKAKRLTLFAHGLSLPQWEAINGLNTLGEPYKTPINEMTTSLNRTMATIGQSVYILNSDGTKIGVTVVNVQNTTVTKKVQHEATVTIEYPEIFLQ